jgi:seryl-tRNA synthetase
MLDIKKIREDFEGMKAGVERRGKGDFGFDQIRELDVKRRGLLAEVEALKNKQNVTSREVPKLKKEGKDVSGLFKEMKQLSNRIKELDSEVADVEAELRNVLLGIPNVPNKDVQEGLDDTDNVELRRVGEPREFDFEAKAHWDIGEALDILDFERAGKLSGARFTVYKGLGAKLERAVINFMLDLHTEEQGYTEILPPFMVNRESMTGTGQLPKFAEDLYHCQLDDFWLIPTAEVPVTNFYRDDILSAKELPVKLTAYTPCFRREAGSAGKMTRGMLRVHQFDKVEMVNFVHPDTSFDQLEILVTEAEDVLKGLGLHYRILQLCSGDMGFSAAKCYDLELWAPGEKQWLEVSSCSCFTDYQARRLNCRFKDSDGKTKLCHTLNGSGVALPRLMVALLEQHQNADGSVTIPEALRPYMNGQEKLLPVK